MDWADYPNFRPEEFHCRYTGEIDMRPDFMRRLQHLRSVYGKPMVITSGFRSRRHPSEAKKGVPGAHSMGRAADIAVAGEDAVRLLKLALDLGFTGIGVNQKSTGRFIHLDDVSAPTLPRPMIWSY